MQTRTSTTLVRIERNMGWLARFTSLVAEHHDSHDYGLVVVVVVVVGSAIVLHAYILYLYNLESD